MAGGIRPNHFNPQFDVVDCSDDFPFCSFGRITETQAAEISPHHEPRLNWGIALGTDSRRVLRMRALPAGRTSAAAGTEIGLQTGRCSGFNRE